MAAILIVLDVFVGIIAVVALIAVWNRLRAHRRRAGAKGVALVIDRLPPRRKNIARLQVSMRMVGPTVRYEVGLDLEADGKPFDAPTPKPAIRPSMGCNDDEMSWGFEIPEESLDNVWVIASWMAVDNANLRMAAIASNLGTPQIYEWRWAADWRISGAGHWRKRRSPTTPPRTATGMGPLELGRAPGRGHAAPPTTDTAESE
ncbi:hypothetical protein [Mycobacterium montefiorense]|uniref:hypothetical protein n=1 Tax=Mycobacterium montefiorense TaxID=154654 RepID=UPI0021DF0267|nr:hypothetical protein [Mycobacterium montefiorense]MCV7428036.1 hypothetical protein [Mycobacterium montefiorense]GLE52015.1 hypothetical protein ATCCBAA256_15910 [Mycobacterium montefiorense]